MKPWQIALATAAGVGLVAVGMTVTHEASNRRWLNSVYEGVETATAGQPIPWRPGYWLWPDGTERTTAPPPEMMRRIAPGFLDQLVDALV